MMMIEELLYITRIHVEIPDDREIIEILKKIDGLTEINRTEGKITFKISESFDPNTVKDEFIKQITNYLRTKLVNDNEEEPPKIFEVSQ